VITQQKEPTKTDQTGKNKYKKLYFKLIASQNKPKEQDSLFGLLSSDSNIPKLKLKEFPPAETKDMLSWEKELLGLYISGHPLDKYKELLKKEGKNIKSIKRIY